MDRWCKDFDSWAICDTVCFHLFDRTPHAWEKVTDWSNERDEFVRRAAFALIASLAVHDKRASTDQFARCLPLIEKATTDERNFVNKGVSWALRVIGRRNREIHAAAVILAKSLSESPNASARWVGKDALKDLTKPAVLKRLKARKTDPRNSTK
ncbi:MAG TPA: DNA alkylation repair protein [Pyrinomonadaceae bacterium]|nr:DNA alkylation repair protein [Pyrinomonadaceae bacterium]